MFKNNSLKKFWFKIKFFCLSLFGGMKNTEDITLHQTGLNVDPGNVIDQQINDHRVAKSLLKGEITQEVIDLRYRTYAVARESEHYNFFSPTLAKKKRDNDYKFNKKSVVSDDDREIVTIQSNKAEVVNLNDSLAMVDKDGKYNDSYDVQYTINVTYKDNIEPRFNIKKYINKIVVKKGNNEYSAVLDLYFSIYANKYDVISKPFITELDKIMNNGVRSDIFDIDTLSFVTHKAYRLCDMLQFKFGDFQLDRIIIYNGSYVVRFITNIIDGGTDLTEQYYSENMAKKYENKEKKELTLNWSPDMNFRTYKCADCGKTVLYDARALDSMNATDDFSDGKVTEYLDFEMTEHEFGRMLCKECAAKAQKELVEKALKDKQL